MSTATYACKSCKEPFTARTADRARGWARFCSKRCKAVKQEARTGQFVAHLAAGRDREDAQPMSDAEAGWDAHKGWLP